MTTNDPGKLSYAEIRASSDKYNNWYVFPFVATINLCGLNSYENTHWVRLRSVLVQLFIMVDAEQNLLFNWNLHNLFWFVEPLTYVCLCVCVYQFRITKTRAKIQKKKNYFYQNVNEILRFLWPLVKQICKWFMQNSAVEITFNVAVILLCASNFKLSI